MDVIDTDFLIEHWQTEWFWENNFGESCHGNGDIDVKYRLTSVTGIASWQFGTAIAGDGGERLALDDVCSAHTVNGFVQNNVLVVLFTRSPFVGSATLVRNKDCLHGSFSVFSEKEQRVITGATVWTKTLVEDK